MNNKPWLKFFTGDWIKGTRCLKAEPKSAWIDLLCYMWENPSRGELFESNDHIALMVGLDGLISRTTIDELVNRGFLTRLNICPKCAPGPFNDVMLFEALSRSCHHAVTPMSRLMSRRMSRECHAYIQKQISNEKNRESARLRQVAHRVKKRVEKEQPYISEVRSQIKKEKRREEGEEEERKDPAAIASVPNAEKALSKRGSPQASFVEQFAALYQVQTGRPFSVRKADYVLVAKLISEHGPEAVADKGKVLAQLCATHSAWFTKNGWADFNLGTLTRHWNSILPEASKPTKDQEFLEELRRQEAIREELNERLNDSAN